MLKSKGIRRGLALATLCGLAIVAAVAMASHYRSSRLVLVAYVANAGNNHVQVLDLETGKILRKIYSGATPWKLIVAPDRTSLWIQHWYSGTTSVVDLRTHEITGTFAARGPGAFSAAGDRFLSFDWPSSALRTIDPKSLEIVKEQASEVPRVYDVAPDPGGGRLLLAQFDPMAKGPHQRYGYVVDYALAAAKPEGGHAPKSLPTGQSPLRIKTVAGGAFFLTADSETNGLSLINKLADRRVVPTCAAPRALVLAPDERRMIVACWPGSGSPKSRLVSYRTDFGSRPWPTIVEEKASDVGGALVAGAFSPSGDRAYFVDRAGKRLIELEPRTLARTREFETGDIPLDIAVIGIRRADRDRAGQTDSGARTLLKSILARFQARSRIAADLRWTENARTRDAGAGEEPRRLAMAYRAPDSLRTEIPGAGIRLAQGGYSAAIDPQGHFWISPRQELIGALYALSALPVEQAIRQLAGDVPGSPYLRAGLALDVLAEVPGAKGVRHRIGALEPEDRVAQLWLDEAGRPVKLIEQFPIFSAASHTQSAFGGMVETTFHDFTTTAGFEYARRLERSVDGQRFQDVAIEDLRVDPHLAPEHFDLGRLGGAPAPPLERADTSASPRESEPGRIVPIMLAGYLSSPQEQHGPYNSSPPTSGPRLPYLADWGVHRVPVPLELQVHNLEHGGVAIQYGCPQGCPEVLAKLAELARGREHLLIAPYPHTGALIALTAWGRIELLDTVDVPRIERFIFAHGGRDHHVDSGAAAPLAH